MLFNKDHKQNTDKFSKSKKLQRFYFLVNFFDALVSTIKKQISTRYVYLFTYRENIKEEKGK